MLITTINEKIAKRRPRTSFITVGFLLIMIFGYMFYSSKEKYLGYETSSAKVVTISSKNAIYDWNKTTTQYKKESGTAITQSKVSSLLEDKNSVDLTNKLPLKRLYNNVDLGRYSVYTISGTIVQRVRTSGSLPNYVVINTQYGKARIYYLYNLPYEVKGEEIKAKVVIMGQGKGVDSDTTKYLILATDAKNTEKVLTSR